MLKNIQECVTYCKELNILYVEDNPDTRQYTMEMLKRFFNDITTAVDGADGLEKFKSSTFDLVLTDINMPTMSGLEMASEMKKINPSVIILILSAHNEIDYFISSIHIGIDGYLLKPLELNQLIGTLSKATEKIHLQNKIKEYQEELEKSNEALEAKVKERTAELEYRLYHDKLTELSNHAAMMQIVDKSPFNILFLIDINGFQKLNDIYGLNAGNLILKKFTQVLKDFNKQNHYSLYRVYGDGFVLYRTCSTIDTIIYQEEKQRLVAALDSLKIYLETIDEEVDIEVTIGVSIGEENAFVKAEMALKHAKQKNKQLVTYTEEIDSSKQLLKDLYWKAEIKTALKNDNIIPVFQGIVDGNQKIVKYEALMRLVQYENGEEKLVSPFLFLDSAVKTQQYNKLTKIMVHKTFEKMENLEVDFSINLSFEDFSNPLIVEFLHEEIEKYKIGKRLIMEVLESEMVSDYEKVLTILESFKKVGVRVAVDDFGSGFSNFEHILKLNPDYIKIDASLIKNILADEKSFTLVKAISEFSKELGIKVIAEYVSSKEIFDMLNTLSIDEYQGFHFSIPSRNLDA